MRITLSSLLIGLLVTAGAPLVGCSSSSPVADGSAPAEYQSLSDDEAADDADDAEPSEQDLSEAPGPQGEPTPGMEATPEMEGQPGAQPQQQPQQQEAAEPPRATGPVATVGDREIPAEEFNEQMEQQLAQMAQQFGGQVPPQFADQIQEELLDQLIQMELINQAVEEADLDIPQERVEERLQEFRDEFHATAAEQFGAEMDFDDYIAQMGLSEEELHEIIEETVAIEILLEDSGVELPTEEDVRAFYDDNPEMFTTPELVEARHLIIGAMGQTDDPQALAQEIHETLQDDDVDFDTIAERYEGQVMVDEGPIARETPPEAQMQQPPEIADAAFALEDGEISDPIQIQQGWVILQRIEHRDDELIPFEEVESQLESQLRNQTLEESLQDFLAQLEADKNVERHPENIQ